MNKVQQQSQRIVLHKAPTIVDEVDDAFTLLSPADLQAQLSATIRSHYNPPQLS